MASGSHQQHPMEGIDLRLCSALRAWLPRHLADVLLLSLIDTNRAVAIPKRELAVCTRRKCSPLDDRGPCAQGSRESPRRGFRRFQPGQLPISVRARARFRHGHVSIARLSPFARKVLFGTCAVIAATAFAARQEYALDVPFANVLNRLVDWFSAVELGPLRVLSFAAFGVSLYWVCCEIQWERVHSTTFRWLAFVGRHSLPVFAWSILVTYAAVALFPHRQDEALRLLGVVLAIASLTIPAVIHALIRQRERRVPASSIVGALQPGDARRAA
jgi:hypothetical protein